MKNPIFQSKPGNVYFAREQKNDFNWDGPAKGNQKIILPIRFGHCSDLLNTKKMFPFTGRRLVFPVGHCFENQMNSSILQ